MLIGKEELPLNSAKDVLSLDLDAFLATMTVPPPLRTASTLELTSEQINSFIIPPPPPPTDIPVRPLYFLIQINDMISLSDPDFFFFNWHL